MPLRQKFYSIFSFGSIILLLGFSVAVIPVLMQKWNPLLVTKLMPGSYYLCWVIDYFCNEHLLFNLQIHQKLAKNEYDFFNQLSVTDCDRLIDWYADWLAVFTHSFGRWCDLCAFQIAGSFRDLLQFRQQEKLNHINPLIAKKYSNRWTEADEQVFKVYYGSAIKRRAFFRVWKICWRIHYHKVRSQYLDFLLDRYGKHYYEYGVFLVNRLRDGDSIRELYDGLDQYQNAFGRVTRFTYGKAVLQSSVCSLKSLLASKKKSS